MPKETVLLPWGIQDQASAVPLSSTLSERQDVSVVFFFVGVKCDIARVITAQHHLSSESLKVEPALQAQVWDCSQ